MGLVKWNNTTVNVDGVPDGAIIVEGGEITRLKQVEASYQLLKSRIPVDVREEELGQLLEKGRRYDPLSQEVTAKQAKVEELSGKLKNFDNMPSDFKVERWNSLVQREAAEARQQKLDVLTKKVQDKVQKDYKVKVSIDPRFIDPAKLQAFNPDDPKAEETWYNILDEAHTAQQEFITKGAGVPPGTPAAQPQIMDPNRMVNQFQSPAERPSGHIAANGEPIIPGAFDLGKQ